MKNSIFYPLLPLAIGVLLGIAVIHYFDYKKEKEVVTTKIQNVHKPMEAELTFVCKKGGRPMDGDWAIYCHHSYNDIDFIKSNGDKVTSPDEIKSICPCDDEVFRRYRY